MTENQLWQPPLTKPDWDRLTVHVRRKRKLLLAQLLGPGQVSPWVNRLIDAALPALVAASAARQRDIAAATAAVDQIAAPVSSGALRTGVRRRRRRA